MKTKTSTILVVAIIAFVAIYLLILSMAKSREQNAKESLIGSIFGFGGGILNLFKSDDSEGEYTWGGYQ